MHRNKLAALAAAALLSLGTAACGSDSTGPSRSGPPHTGTISVMNSSDAPIDAVKFSNCSDPDWGQNRLDAGETIAPGATRSWTADPGCYDVKASIGTLAGTWYDRQLTANGLIQVALDVAVSSVRPAQPAVAGAGEDLKAR